MQQRSMGAGHIGGGGEELHPYLIYHGYQEMTSSCRGQSVVQVMTSKLSETAKNYRDRVKARNHRLTMTGAA